MQYWLFKSEPLTFSIDDLIHSPRQTAHWDGVRNYQVRNMLRDEINVGDKVFFYHSNCKLPGIVGIMEVTTAGHVDESAFDRKSPYFDPKSCRERPIWYQVNVRFLQKFSHCISLGALRKQLALKKMQLLRKGNRLSITKVQQAEWEFICQEMI